MWSGASPTCNADGPRAGGRVRAALGRIDRWNPLTDYDRLLCIYEYMQDTMAYDLRELQACRRLGRGPSPMAHTAYGTLVQGKGVCDGTAAAFCLLASLARWWEGGPLLRRRDMVITPGTSSACEAAITMWTPPGI